MTLDGPVLNLEDPWFRGNLHSHTTESDGAASPAEVMAHYRSLGYDFLALSDHDILTAVPPAEIPQGLTLFPAYEASVGPHILCVNVEEAYPKTSDCQTVIDRVQDGGGFTVLNHPNWGKSFSHWDHEVMERLEGYLGIEIYNGIVEILEGTSYALDRWDRLLSSGKRIWGFAHDDSHMALSVGLGWIMVQAVDSTKPRLMESIRSGRFYASTGVTLQSISIEEETLSLRSNDADRIRFVGPWGKLLGLADAVSGTLIYRTGHGYVTESMKSEGEGISAHYRFRGDEGYVRCEVLGRGGRCAWTQPVWVNPD